MMDGIQLLSVGAWAPFDHLFRMSRYPAKDETIPLDMEASELSDVYFGDCSINLAAAAAKLGVKTALATIAGNDFESSGYGEHLKELGVDLSAVEIRENEKSGHNYLYFDRNGDGFCFSCLGAAKEQDEARVPQEAMAPHVAVSEKFSRYTLDILERAHRSGSCTYVNGMVETAGELTDSFLSAADFLFINEHEFERLKAAVGDEAGLFGKFGLRAIFVTSGKRGSTVLTREGSAKVTCSKPETVVDSTGAGDAYAGGTISGIIKGLSFEKAAELGATVSSFVIEKWGCQTNLPSWEQARERHNKSYMDKI